MRFLKWTAIILAILVTGLWFGASYFVKKGAEAFVADMAAKGMVAGTPGISVGGFPARMDLALSAVKFVDPKTGAGWEGAELHIFAPSWKPWQITAELPPSQTLTLPGMTGNQTVGVTSQGLTASVRVSPDTRLALQEVTAGGAALQATSSLGWVVGVGDLRAQLLVAAADPKAYALTLNATEIAPDPSLAAALAAVSLPDLPVSDLPAKLESAHLALMLHMSTPLDLMATGTNPHLTGLDLQDLTAQWGPLKFAASGALAADASGHAEGRIEIEITHWDRLPALLVATGAVKPEIAPTIGNALKALAAEGGDPAVLRVPLVMEAGRMSLGPLPLGEAPMMTGATGS